MEVKSIKFFFSESDQSDNTIECHLSPEISADDVEIRWFKETECVCFYKNRRFIEGIGYEGRVSLCNEELKSGNVSFQLKESDVGNYLCQVISGSRREEKTVNKSLKPTTETLITEQPGKKWTAEDRVEMANSALSAVFQSLEKREKPEKTHLQEDPQGNIVPQTSREIEEKQNQIEEKATQQEETKQICGDEVISRMEINGCEPEERKKITHLDNLQSDQGQMANQSNKNEDESLKKKQKRENNESGKKKIKVFSISDGKTNECKNKFIDTLQTRIDNLKEVSTEEESDIILNFCPIVSRAGTDIDAALKKIKNSAESKLNVLVVLHHTFDPEKTVLDSSRSVNREDTLTVDLLFYEDTGLLECQKNSDAFDKVVNWLILQGKEKGIPISPFQNKGFSLLNWFTSENSEHSGQNMQQMKSTSSHSVKYFLNVTGDAKKHHMHFINDLKKNAQEKHMSLMEVSTEKDSDVIFLFSPEITDYHRREDKLVVLISLHDTKDPGSVDISRLNKRRAIFPVDCVFDRKGLLDCQINRDEISAVSDVLNQNSGAGVKRA